MRADLALAIKLAGAAARRAEISRIINVLPHVMVYKNIYAILKKDREPSKTSGVPGKQH
jgi:hypothetical protein